MENVARIIFLVKHGFQIGFQNLFLYIDEVEWLSDKMHICKDEMQNEIHYSIGS